MRTKMGVARCCCPAQVERCTNPFCDPCYWSFEGKIDAPSTNNPVHSERCMTRGCPFVGQRWYPSYVSIAADMTIDGTFANEGLRIAMQPQQTSGTLPPIRNDNKWFYLEIGTKAVNDYWAFISIRSPPEFCVNPPDDCNYEQEVHLDGIDGPAYTPGGRAEIEWTPIELGKDEYHVKFYYRGELIDELGAPNDPIRLKVFWYDPMFHRLWWFTTPSDSYAENWVTQWRDCLTCDSDPIQKFEPFREAWYPNASGVGIATVGGTNLLPLTTAGVTTGGIKDNRQWNLASGQILHSVKDLIVLSKDFTVSFWQTPASVSEINQVLRYGPLTALSDQQPNGFQKDNARFDAINNVDGGLATSLTIESQCITDPYTLSSKLAQQAGPVFTKNLHVFVYLSEFKSWDLWVGDNATGQLKKTNRQQTPLHSLQHYDGGVNTTQPDGPMNHLTLNYTGSVLGLVDQIAIWPRALSPAEVSQVWNGGNGTLSLPT